MNDWAQVLAVLAYDSARVEASGEEREANGE